MNWPCVLAPLAHKTSDHAVSAPTTTLERMLAPIMGPCYIVAMRIIAKKALREFWEIHPDAEQPLRSWHAKTKQANLESTSDVKMDYGNASFVAGSRVIFNIKGNQYRLVVAINYPYRIVYIRFVGTHSEYDRIDPTTI